MKTSILFLTLLTLTIACPNAQAQKPVLTVPTGHGQSPYYIKFSPDDKYLASGDFFSIKLWDVKEAKEIRTFMGNAFDFSPDGKLIATGAGDGIIRLYEFENGNLHKFFQAHFDEIIDVSFSRDGKYLISASNSLIKLWNLDGKDINTNSLSFIEE